MCRSFRLIFKALAACLTVCLLASNSFSQDLELHRVVNLWPDIELYYSVHCNNNDITKSITKDKFQLFENGLEIKDFLIDCYSVNSPVSLAIVLPDDFGFAGAGQYYTRIAVYDLLDILDSTRDEITIVNWWSNDFTDSYSG